MSMIMLSHPTTLLPTCSLFIPSITFFLCKFTTSYLLTTEINEFQQLQCFVMFSMLKICPQFPEAELNGRTTSDYEVHQKEKS